MTDDETPQERFDRLSEPLSEYNADQEDGDDTMSDTICGAPTGSGEPCKNPAGENGRCWIPSHQPDADGDTSENPQGRPSKFSDESARQAVQAARRGMSKAGCCRAAGVTKGTVDNWLEQEPTYTDEDGEQREFFHAFTRARAQGEAELIDGGLRDPDVDSSFAKFMLASSFEYKKTEAREHTGEDGGPVEISFSEEVVKTGWSEENE